MFQIIAFCIVIIYLLYWFVREHDARSFFMKFAVISAASWIAEETSIRMYHFYQYSPDWILFLGHVPVLVILIWPLVIHSGWELASQSMAKNRRHVHLVAALIIWIDASLVETISVKAGFWSWNAVGVFGVPLIGIFGWLYFSILSILILRIERVRKVGIGKLFFILTSIVLGTHLLIVATWWLVFRWILFPIDEVFIAAMAWLISTSLVYFIQRRNLGIHMDGKALVIRVPPVVLFLTLYLQGSPDTFHTAYASAFSFSYLFLIYRFSKEEAMVKSYSAALQRLTN
jgi:hypothetical protein